MQRMCKLWDWRGNFSQIPNEKICRCLYLIVCPVGSCHTTCVQIVRLNNFKNHTITNHKSRRWEKCCLYLIVCPVGSWGGADWWDRFIAISEKELSGKKWCDQRKIKENHTNKGKLAKTTQPAKNKGKSHEQSFFLYPLSRAETTVSSIFSVHIQSNLCTIKIVILC